MIYEIQDLYYPSLHKTHKNGIQTRSGFALGSRELVYWAPGLIKSDAAFSMILYGGISVIYGTAPDAMDKSHICFSNIHPLHMTMMWDLSWSLEKVIDSFRDVDAKVEDLVTSYLALRLLWNYGILGFNMIDSMIGRNT